MVESVHVQRVLRLFVLRASVSDGLLSALVLLALLAFLLFVLLILLRTSIPDKLSLFSPLLQVACSLPGVLTRALVSSGVIFRLVFVLL